MTDEEKIALVKTMVGDTPSNPWYPMFTDDEYRGWLELYDGSIDKMVRTAAISASMFLSTVNSREVIGDLVFENKAAESYQKALGLLISNPMKTLPDGMMPWSANTGCNPIKLLKLPECDDERSRCCGT